MNNENEEVELLDETNTSLNIEQPDFTTIQEDTPIEPKENKVNDKPNNKYESYEKRLTKQLIITGIFIIILMIFILLFFRVKNIKRYSTENATVNYQVCLKENNYYKEKCLNEDKEYISTLVDNLRIDFNYNNLFKDVTKYKYKYYVKTKLEVSSNEESSKIIYEDEEKLTKKQTNNGNGNVVSISDTVDLPFQKYNKYALEYVSKYALLANAKLSVEYVVEDGTNTRTVSSITIPLTKQTFSIEKNEIQNNVIGTKIKSLKPLEISLLIAIIILLIPTSYLIFKSIKLLKSLKRKKTTYEKKLEEILNNYDRVIVSGKDNEYIESSDKIYEVKSFFELLDVRDTIDKPILYYKINSVKSEFYVQDDKCTYKYVMKEADFEK